MLIKPRKVRKSSKFSSRIRGASRQRQEYAASIYSHAIIQALLAMALVVLAVRAYQAIDAHTETLPLTAKLVLPVVLIGGAFLTARSCLRNVRAAREMWYTRRRRDRDPD